MSPGITLYEFGLNRSRQARWTLLECGLEFKSVSDIEIPHREECITALFEQNNKAFLHAAGVLGKILGETDHLVGKYVSVIDILVGFTLNRGKGAGLLDTFPNLQNYLVRLKERPHCTLKAA